VREEKNKRLKNKIAKRTLTKPNWWVKGGKDPGAEA